MATHSISVFSPGESYGQRRLAGYSPWGRRELDTTEHACAYVYTMHSLGLGFLINKYRPLQAGVPSQSSHALTNKLIKHYIQPEIARESCSVVSDSLWPHGLYSPWDSPGQNTGVGSLSLLQGIFPTQVGRSNPGLPLYRQILYQLSHQENLPKRSE